jgi:hypothetical protein
MHADTLLVKPTTKSVDLGVVSVGVWRELVALYQLQQLGCVEYEKNRSKDRSLWQSAVDDRRR